MKRGDTITLKDRQTLLNHGLTELKTQIESIETYTMGGTTWELVELVDSNLVVIVKSHGPLKDLKICFTPDEFPVGDRREWLNLDFKWLFLAPNDPENFVPSELLYTEEIVNGDYTFRQKGPTILATPQCKIHEWVCSDVECENNQLVVFEIGGDNNGGFIRFYQGVNVTDEDIEITK